MTNVKMLITFLSTACECKIGCAQQQVDDCAPVRFAAPSIQAAVAFSAVIKGYYFRPREQVRTRSSSERASSPFARIDRRLVHIRSSKCERNLLLLPTVMLRQNAQVWTRLKAI
jgi:hypothetical protein